MNKTLIRRDMLDRRKRMSADEASRLSGEICRHISLLTRFRQSRNVMIYVPVNNEADLRSLTRYKNKFYVPRMTSEYEFEAAEYEPEALVAGAHGIPEPAGTATIAPDELDLIILPLVACDIRGERLGYGAGCYDRYVPKTHAFLLGAGYAFQRVNALPQEATDLRLDAVCSEEGAFLCV